MMDKLAYAEQFNKAMQYFINTLPEEKALVVAGLYTPWQVGVKYVTGEWVTYGVNSIGDAQLYQILQDHTSAEEYTPDVATSLYKKVGVSEDGTPTWVQPLGATDAYKVGDIVMYNDKKWISNVDNNVWEPGVYGWDEYKKDVEPTEPDASTEDDVPEFVQPTGAQDAYNKGDKIKYNDKVYESLIDGNTYAPDAYPAGWQEVTE